MPFSQNAADARKMAFLYQFAFSRIKMAFDIYTLNVTAFSTILGYFTLPNRHSCDPRLFDHVMHIMTTCLTETGA